MQTITKTYNLYSFDELSDSAKKKALDEWRCNEEFYDGYEYRDTIEAIEKALDIKVKICQECGGSCSFYTCSNDPYVEEITDSYRLTKCIINNWYDKLVTKKSYWTKYKPNRKSKDRRSKVLKVHNNCPFTGIWTENNFVKVLDEVITYKRFYNDINDLLYDAVGALFKQYESDYDYYYSEENLEELSNINEWLYYEDGEKY